MNWLNKLLSKNNNRIGLQLESDQVSYCLFDPEPAALRIIGADKQQLDHKTLDDQFKKLMSQLNAKGRDAYWILSPDHYRLMTVERPMVPEEEMADAIKWQVRDLIDLPLEEAVISYFDYPEDIPGPSRLYVVVARRDVITRIIKLSESADLNLDSIDIEELSIGHLISPMLQEGHNIAFVGESSKGISMHCYVGDKFCFTRALPGVFLPRGLPEQEFTLDLDEVAEPESDSELTLDLEEPSDTQAKDNQPAPQANYDQLLLEIQRTLDYYESQIAKRSVTKIIVPDIGEPTTRLVDLLKNELGLQVEVVKLEQVCRWTNVLSESHLSKQLGVCSAAFRNIEVAHAAD
ncbi:MAG: hypothetical protein HWE27_18400 [Gammaproteobacteria bacterium]|nr:hypothetical protein [Gammaproteobacteria bacterium]